MRRVTCACGCGQSAPLAKRTRHDLGHVKGQPLRFINGHNAYVRRTPDDERYTIEDGGLDTPCWMWAMAVNPETGYGVTTINGRSRNAHRASYERLAGPVPDGLVLDHICRNRACVNPDHLEPVTQGENLRRGSRWAHAQ